MLSLCGLGHRHFPFCPHNPKSGSSEQNPTPRPLTGLELSEDVRSYVTFPTAVPFGPSSPALGDPGLLFLEVPFLTESPGPVLSAADTSLSVVWVVNVRVWQSFSGKGQMATL